MELYALETQRNARCTHCRLFALSHFLSFFLGLTRDSECNEARCNSSLLKVKNDPRSEFSNLSNWKEEA